MCHCYYTDMSHNSASRRVGKNSYKAKSKEAANNRGVAPTAVCSSRDASIFLFKSLGKILYCKSKWNV